ncbi:MAG TPA: GNAT family N-acetyltransferase [Pseudonocardiaceae bacterium]|jgi:GNAT superfamily N-acetyltransferase|nr:GNAT family N-acetyltransferase [Pseudonocardiaceae bacterium]
MTELEIRRSTYDDPDAAKLINEVQQYYAELYGRPDVAPSTPADFLLPTGLFLIGYVDGTPVTTGAWRLHDADEPGYVEGDVELKRMYVVPAAQGRGHARTILAELERTARAEGHRRMVLSTGALQVAAIQLYLSSGYELVPPFGFYRDKSLVRCYVKPLAAGA